MAVAVSREQFARPFAVTAHAVDQYRTRVDPNASRDEAMAELQRALQNPSFARPARDGATLYGCRDRFERRIGIVVAPPPGEGDWPIVVTVGGWLLWQEYKADWERMYQEWAAERGLPKKDPGQPDTPVPLPLDSTPNKTPKPLTTQQKRKANGLCAGCGKVKPDEGHTRCAECRAKHAAATRALRVRRVMRGQCPRCGRTVEAGEKRCSVCREKDKARPSRHKPRGALPPSARRQAQIDFISRYSGLRSLGWIAERLRVSVRTVANIIDQEGLGPTTRGDWLTTSQVAEIIGYSPQWVSAMCRSGRMRAHRNPTSRYHGHRWWLINRAEVNRWLALAGRKSDDPRLTEPSAWPRVVTRRPWRRRQVKAPAALPRFAAS